MGFIMMQLRKIDSDSNQNMIEKNRRELKRLIILAWIVLLAGMLLINQQNI